MDLTVELACKDADCVPSAKVAEAARPHQLPRTLKSGLRAPAHITVPWNRASELKLCLHVIFNILPCMQLVPHFHNGPLICVAPRCPRPHKVNYALIALLAG